MAHFWKRELVQEAGTGADELAESGLERVDSSSLITELSESDEKLRQGTHKHGG